MMRSESLQPTDPLLVWGRKQDRLDNRFRARAVIVEHLISHWTESDWSAVDVSGGAGRWLSTLAPRFSKFTHLDLSPDALRVARTENSEFANVEYGLVNLLQPRESVGGRSDTTWDTVFCLDTLLYRGDFVETVLKNIRAFMSPRGVAIVDVPMRCRAFIAQQIKRRRTGPERTFSPRETRVLFRNSGYACLEAVYQYREMSPSMHHFLAIRRMDGWIPWPSTWMYLVLRRTDH